MGIPGKDSLDTIKTFLDVLGMRNSGAGTVEVTSSEIDWRPFGTDTALPPLNRTPAFHISAQREGHEDDGAFVSVGLHGHFGQADRPEMSNVFFECTHSHMSGDLSLHVTLTAEEGEVRPNGHNWAATFDVGGQFRVRPDVFVRFGTTIHVWNTGQITYESSWADPEHGESDGGWTGDLQEDLKYLNWTARWNYHTDGWPIMLVWFEREPWR